MFYTLLSCIKFSLALNIQLNKHYGLLGLAISLSKLQLFNSLKCMGQQSWLPLLTLAI